MQEINNNNAHFDGGINIEQQTNDQQHEPRSIAQELFKSLAKSFF